MKPTSPPKFSTCSTVTVPGPNCAVRVEVNVLTHAGCPPPCIQVEDPGHPIQLAHEGFGGNQVHFLSEGPLLVDLRVVQGLGSRKTPLLIEGGRKSLPVVVPQ